MESKPRSPWVSALLSFPCAGLGQVYNGQLAKGIAFWLLSLVLSVGLLTTGLPRHFLGLLGLHVISLVWGLATAVEASLAAIRLKEISLRNYNRWYFYLLLATAATIISFGSSVAYRNVSGLRAFSVPSISMSPTILPGDRLEADMNYYLHHSPQRGDVVILKVPQLGAKATFVKRIVAVAGDRVTFSNKVVYVNGRPALIPGAATGMGGVIELERLAGGEDAWPPVWPHPAWARTKDKTRKGNRIFRIRPPPNG